MTPRNRFIARTRVTLAAVLTLIAVGFASAGHPGLGMVALAGSGWFIFTPSRRKEDDRK